MEKQKYPCFNSKGRKLVSCKNCLLVWTCSHPTARSLRKKLEGECLK